MCAGWWKPTAISGTSPDDVKRWGAATYNYLLSLHRSAAAASAGVIYFTAYLLYSQQVRHLACSHPRKRAHSALVVPRHEDATERIMHIIWFLQPTILYCCCCVSPKS